LSLDLFNSITGKQFIIADLFQGGFIISFIVVGLIAGFISGIYPAFYLSSIKPVAVLKGESISGKGNSRIRQVLVVIQFTMSILIAIVAIFMFMQLKYSQEKELGFDKDNLICIPLSEGMKSKYYSLKNELLKEVLIEGVTAARSNPVRIGSNSGNAWWEGKDPDKEVLIGTNTVDYDYLKTMKMELVAGRDFSREFTGDQVKDTTGNFLVNEEAVKTMGITDPVGKSFRFMGINGRIVGVLKNFHFKSSDQAIEPIAFALTEPAYLSVILIRIAGGNIVESVKVVEKKWNELIPEYPLDYTFIDQDFDSLFKAQLRLTTLLKYFTLLALIIACLGLYGLSSYSAERRTNEVGIRKAMGAGSLMIMYTMSKEFLVLVIISIAIALPLGLIIVKNLLKEFAYRIDMSFAVFAGIAVGAIIISILTISFQAFKSSLINPAEALKVE
jgi:ABC-type antimicrobial peptide transport system permease subunit